MTDKVKSKDKEKERKRKEDLPVSEAKRQRGQAEDKQKKEKKEKEKKGKEKEDKERSKEKEKASEDKEKEKVETPAEPQPARAQGGTSAPPEAEKKEAEVNGEKEATDDSEKKLKSWQDDALEVDSDDEAKAAISTVKALTKLRGKGFSEDAPAEADTLDKYMADLSKTSAVGDKDGGMGVIDASRVKSITLEEIEALMGAQEPGSEQQGGSSSSTAQPAEAKEEEDEDFHTAFMETMRKLTGEVPQDGESLKDFEASAKFAGARPGFVFKRGKRGMGYYRDVGPFGSMPKEKPVSGEALPDFRRAKQVKRALDEDFDGQGEADDEDDGQDEAEAEAEAEKVEDEQMQADTPAQEKPVETKKEKRRKRREAKEAAAKAKAETAARRAKDGFGEGDGDRMDSDPDRSEESSEEQMESYFDLVKRFTTKKTLPVVDHDKIEYKPFRKNLYVQVKEITNMKDHEVEDLRRTQGEITVRGKRCPHPVKSFLQCGLPEKIMKILEKRDYEKPFPIQMQAMPALMCGRDVIGVAQTGSGKTLAYLLPLIRHILDQAPLANGDGPVGFVVAPTRELALQIQREANVFCKAGNLTSVCAYGGGLLGEQLSALKKGAELLVGTPGRLIDVLTTSGGKITNLRRVTFLVLDEADRMFDMGFEPQIGMFLQSTRPDKQVAMFSATLPAHVEALARKVLKKPLEISVGERNAAAANVTQFVEVLDESQKFYRLLQLLGEWHEHGAIMIFVHQQKDVDEMFTELLKYGYPPLTLHGGQDQQDRDFTLQDFKDGISNILIATSVAARGIDVKNVILVVNFKVPDHLEDYIHRVGRTGRAGKPGFAYTFIQPDEGDKAQDMVDAMRQCNQEIPAKLKALAEEHQTAVNTGKAQKRKRWGGFGGKSFSYENSEKSRQQQDRQQAKSELLIGDWEEEDNFKDPWLEPDKPAKGKGKGKGKKDADTSGSQSSSNPADTVAAAAQVAAKMQAANGIDAPNGTGAGLLPAPQKAKVQVLSKKSDKEIQEQARQMAEDTLKSLPDEVREKQLPALTEKLVVKLRKAEQEKLAEAAAALAPVPAPPPEQPAPKEKEPEPTTPVMKAIPLVPGVLGQGLVPAQATMVTRAIESLQTAAKPGAGTSHLAEEKAAKMMGAKDVEAGMHMDELEINDYPQIARQKITHRDPLVAIEEMTGCKLQVRGQHFTSARQMPEGGKKLFVEIVGPTQVAVSKAKNEVFKMMEALAIRTLNIPGMTRAIGGAPGKYDPFTGK